MSVTAAIRAAWRADTVVPANRKGLMLSGSANLQIAAYVLWSARVEKKVTDDAYHAVDLDLIGSPR